MAADAAKKKAKFLKLTTFQGEGVLSKETKKKKEKRVHFFSPNDDDDNV